MKETMRKLAKLTIGLPVAVVSAVLITMPPFTIAAIPLFIEGVGLINDATSKKDTKNSFFKVSRGDKLVENPFRLISTIKYSLKKDKTKNFMNDFINCLSQIDVKRNGEPIKYKTDSHYFTYKRLKDLEEMGYIENLSYKEKFNGKEKSFLLENIAMGNFKNAFKKKKKLTIEFNLTGKDFNCDEIKEYIDSVSKRKQEEKEIETVEKNNVNSNTKENVNSDVNLHNNKTKEELLKLREICMEAKRQENIQTYYQSNNEYELESEERKMRA